MDTELKTKWVKALRSGKYESCQARLVSPGGDAFCCLGVLADVQGCVWKDAPHSYLALAPIMPRGRKTWNCAGNGSGDGEYLKPERAGGLALTAQVYLAKMNDEGKSFKQIADWIEANL
jgi:hypothetical protein